MNGNTCIGERDYIDLSYEHINVIKERKRLILPHVIQSFRVVEIYIVYRGQVVVESQGTPIRYGKHYGSRLHIGGDYGNIDINPKFVWTGNEWILNTFGTFLFAEVEINEKKGSE
jgi:hypothetical protein